MKIFDLIEYTYIIFLSKVLGINYIVKYLRNPNPKINRKILKNFGAKIGKGTIIKRSLLIDNTYEDINSLGDFSNLIIGTNCYIGDECFLDLSNKIEIGSNVIISAKVSLLTHADCNRSEYLSGILNRKCLPVKIFDDSWIGFNSTIMPGVIIQPKSIIAAHSFVNKDNISFTIFGGIPAKKIMDI